VKINRISLLFAELSNVGEQTMRWSWSPAALITLVLLAVLYGWTVWSAWKQDIKDERGEKPLQWYHLAAFGVALVLAFLIFFSPVNAGGQQYFVLHAVQLVGLTTVCVPLMMFAWPVAVSRRLLGLPGIRDILEMLSVPLLSSLAFNFAFIIWHIPVLYAQVVKDTNLYHLQLLCIFVLAFLSWGPLCAAWRGTRHMRYPTQMLYTFLDGQPMDWLAFALLITTSPLYSSYLFPSLLGIPNFSDQAAGALVLLCPGIVDLVILSVIFFRWMMQIEQRTRAKDQERVQEEEEYEIEYEVIEKQ
jgi:putative membrane protein